MRRQALVATTLAALGTHGLLGIAAGKPPNLCAQTTAAMRRACDGDARDNRFVELATCTNLSDEGSRRSCRRAAKETSEEARGECAEQRAARADLCDALGPAAYDPQIDPGRFLSPQATAASPNPFFPLKPGTRWIYEGGGETVTVTVTDQTRVIQGVVCITVTDVVKVGGQVNEDTEDYFAQDVEGSVWYFGELSKSFENGILESLDGSFTAGVEGAKPGIVMPAVRTVGATYRQEFALGEAEDAAEILDVAGTATVPGASCAGTCVVTRDFTPLEPGQLERKYYAPGVGLILEVNDDTGERLELQSFTSK